MAHSPVRTGAIAERYERDGFFFPLQVLNEGEAIACRAELERLEKRIVTEELGHNNQLNHGHVVFRFASELVRHPRILDAVEGILGPDILCWSSTFFTKEPRTPSFVSWHQDLRYFGLSGDALVSVWVALGRVTEAHGCMRFVPGSHRLGILEHRDTHDAANFLTRGQAAVCEVDEGRTVKVALEAGQASLHHGRLLHASSANATDERRVGYVINYIATGMRQVVAGHDYAVLVRGEDRHGHFELVPPPEDDLTPEALDWHRRILGAQAGALYQETDTARSARREPAVRRKRPRPQASGWSG